MCIQDIVSDQKPKKNLPWSQTGGEIVIVYARENMNEDMWTIYYVNEAMNCK